MSFPLFLFGTFALICSSPLVTGLICGNNGKRDDPTGGAIIDMQWETVFTDDDDISGKCGRLVYNEVTQSDLPKSCTGNLVPNVAYIEEAWGRPSNPTFPYKSVGREGTKLVCVVGITKVVNVEGEQDKRGAGGTVWGSCGKGLGVQVFVDESDWRDCKNEEEKTDEVEWGKVGEDENRKELHVGKGITEVDWPVEEVDQAADDVGNVKEKEKVDVGEAIWWAEDNDFGTDDGKVGGAVEARE